MKKDYRYEATVKSVYDGDTITVDIDLGFMVEVKNQKLRLHGINAPEVRGAERPEGLVSRDWLREQLPLGSLLIVQTYRDKKGKYGRWIADLLIERDGELVNLNQTMVLLGLAKPVDY